MISQTFEWFNDSPPDMPVRSRLNPLRPIGRGTGLVQSLPSYIHHLAASHRLPTWTLVCRIIAPQFSRKTVATKHGHCDLFGNMGASTLGNNQTAAEAVGIVEELTSVAGLDALTLLKFGKSVAGPLIRPKQAWCSECLSEFQEKKHGVYQPLLWSIRDVNACPLHGVELKTRCSVCAKEHKPLTRYAWNGCCPRCNNRLGGNRETQPATDWEVRVAQTAADAIVGVQELECPAESTYFAANMEKLCLSFADGNLSKLGRQIQIHHSNIRDWIVLKQLPSLSSLLRLSAVFGVPVTDWVTKSIEFTATSFSALDSAAPKRPLRRCHLPAVRAKLEFLINTDQFPPSSLAEICRGLGTEQSFIARKYPDLARTLIDRRAQYLTIKKQIGRQFTRLLVESTFNKLLCDGIRPTATQMAKALPRGIVLRDRNALEEYNRLRAELGEEFRAIQTDLAAPALPNSSKSPDGKNKVARAVLEP